MSTQIEVMPEGAPLFGTIREISRLTGFGEKVFRRAVKADELRLYYADTERGRLYVPEVIAYLRRSDAEERGKARAEARVRQENQLG